MNLDKIRQFSKSSTIKIVLEIAIVFGIMLTIKSIADYFKIIGAGSLAMWCGIIIATFFMKKPKLKWKELGLFLPKGLKDWGINILFAFMIVILVFSIMGLIVKPTLEAFGLSNPPDVASRFSFFMGKPLVFVSYLIGVVWLGAALGEELLMRGYFLNRLVDLIGNSKLSLFIAVFLHATVFGMLHIYQGLGGVIATGLIGAIFGVVYLLIKRRLFPLILAHAIINSISLIVLYLTNGVIS